MRGTTIAAVFIVWSAAAQAVEGYALYTRAPGGGGIFRMCQDLYVKRLGGSATKIDGGGVHYANFSPDGARVVYSRLRSGNSELVVADRDGSNKRVLRGGFSSDFGKSPWPCWRQSGSFIYSTDTSGSVYAIDVTSGARSTVYTSSQSVRGASVNTQLTRMLFLGSTTRITTADLTVGPSSEKGYDGCGWYISPDGTKFCNNQSDHQTVYIRRFDGSVYKQVTTSKYFNRHRWSNNSSKWITYPQGPSFQLTEWSQVYVHNIETGEKVQVTSQTSYNEVAQDFWVGSTGGPTKPGVATRDATNVTTSSARLNGEVTSTGGENPTVKIHWGDNDAGTGTWDHVENLGTKGAGTFYKDVSGLASGKTYYFRCYASNSAGGTWASSSKSFTTGTPVDPTVITNPSDGQDLVEGQNYTLTGTGAGTLTWSYDADSDGKGRVTIGTGSSVGFTVPTGVGSPKEITIFLAGDGGEASVLCNIISGGTPEPPVISLEPTSLSFSATQGGANPADKTVSVINSGGGTLSSVSVSEGASWLTVGRSGSGNSQLLTNSCDISGLSPDTYSVTVTVSGGGAQEGASYRVTLAVASAPPPPPETKITSPAGGADLVEGSTVTLKGEGAGTLTWSYDANSDGLGRIDIGTGSSVSFTVPTGVSSPKEITIFLAGGGGEVSVLCDIVSGGTPPNQPPVAVSSASPTSGEPPLLVDFTGSGTDPDGRVASYHWTFGDGASSTDESPSHTYGSPGTYVATLTVTDDDGATASDSVEITVEDGPYIDITSPAEGHVWYVGTTPAIRWATNLDDVTIQYKTGADQFWQVVDGSVRAGDPGWLSFRWEVPDKPSAGCRIMIAGYFGEAPTESGAFEIRAVTDEDTDGMDDGWETRQFGDLSHDGSEDTDGDGFTDYDEFMAATDPGSADSSILAAGGAFACAARSAGRAGGALDLVPWMLVLAALGLVRRIPGDAAAAARTVGQPGRKRPAPGRTWC